MPSDLENLQSALLQSLAVINDTEGVEPTRSDHPTGDPVVPTPSSWSKAGSLLAQCESACRLHADKQRPVIRLVHHLACSGGTLIAKCISAMPNVFLLSEVHPYSRLHLPTNRPKCLPTDIASLSRYAAIPAQSKLAGKLFLDSIVNTHEHVSGFGGKLVLRDHSHTDFCTGPEVVASGAVSDVLADFFELRSVITVRDPVDSYMSLGDNNWLDFSPSTFDEYCRRYLAFLDCYAALPLFRYEDFVASPKPVMEHMCEALDLRYSPLFEDIFGVFTVTGNSGRSHSERISPRLRKPVSSDLRQEILDSEHYGEIAARLGYELES